MHHQGQEPTQCSTLYMSSNNLGYNGSKSFKLHFFQNFWGKQVEENAFEQILSVQAKFCKTCRLFCPVEHHTCLEAPGISIVDVKFKD